jgi:hypothetical protein
VRLAGLPVPADTGARKVASLVRAVGADELADQLSIALPSAAPVTAATSGSFR